MFSSLKDRKEAAGFYKIEVEKLMDEKHYNPITKKYMLLIVQNLVLIWILLLLWK